MSWTDDRVALLKKLWGDGKTAAEIAKELGGVTRNAVIGKAHRLKLSNRASPIQPAKKVSPPKAQNQNTPAPPAPAASVVQQPKKRAKDVDDDNRERVSLADLKPGGCRWPMGDPREENFGFCGCKSLSGLPYCMEHAQLAYQPATRNRIMKDQAVVSSRNVSLDTKEKTKKAAS